MMYNDTFFPTKMAKVDSNKNLGKCVCAGAGDEGLGRVEGHVMNGLVMLLPVGSDFLHARPVVQHPQTHRAVVACWRYVAGERRGSFIEPYIEKKGFVISLYNTDNFFSIFICTFTIILSHFCSFFKISLGIFG